MQEQPSATAAPTFRELTGPEMAEVWVHDLEQAIIELLASGSFKRQALEYFRNSGSYGAGACYPVVVMAGQLRIKVYASVESARSKEAVPAPQFHSIEIKTGEPGELVVDEEVKIERVVGVNTETAVDKVRLETGQTPLSPQRDEHGQVVNSPTVHEVRKIDYSERVRKSRETKARHAREDMERELKRNG